jgi:hypothetical protein
MWRAVLVAFLTTSLAFPVAEANAQRRSGAHSEASVRAYLRNRLHSARVEYPDTRYVLAWVDLNGDGRNEAVVRILSNGYCGSGGCNLYVLSPWGRRWSLVGRMTATKAPIRVLNSRSHGWRDLAVGLHDCCENGRWEEALLPFDGRIYPFNPSTPPSRRIRRGVPGRVLISGDDEGRLLF